MNRRVCSMLLACALSLSLLSACGGNQSGSSSSIVSGSASSSQNDSPSASLPDGSTPDVSAPDASQPVEEPEPAATLTLNKSDFTLKSAGATYKLKAAVTGAETAITWSSNDENVATVAEDGTVTAVAPGSATITAACGELTAQCIVRCDWEIQTEQPAPQQPSTSTDTAVSVDLNAFVADLAAKYGENFAANANVVEYGMHNDLYPGISDIATNQLVIYQPMMGAVVCEIALAEVTNSSDVAAVKAIFQARIDTQVNGGAWYPESIQGWQNNSRIVTNGNYAMMIAWEFCDDAAADFKGLF